MSDVDQVAQETLELLQRHKVMIATAESCTGGMIVAALTDIAGSSSAVDRGFITYSNDAKTKMLGVPEDLIAQHGAVSREVALAMAEGALANSQADIAVSVTGVAGPGGGSVEKPVGTVHFGCVRRGHEPRHSHQLFSGQSRSEVRNASVCHALHLVQQALGS